jgi:hypothetical protein
MNSIVAIYDFVAKTPRRSVSATSAHDARQPEISQPRQIMLTTFQTLFFLVYHQVPFLYPSVSSSFFPRFPAGEDGESSRCEQMSAWPGASDHIAGEDAARRQREIVLAGRLARPLPRCSGRCRPPPPPRRRRRRSAAAASPPLPRHGMVGRRRPAVGRRRSRGGDAAARSAVATAEWIFRSQFSERRRGQLLPDQCIHRSNPRIHSLFQHRHRHRAARIRHSLIIIC